MTSSGRGERALSVFWVPKYIYLKEARTKVATEPLDKMGNEGAEMILVGVIHGKFTTPQVGHTLEQHHNLRPGTRV